MPEVVPNPAEELELPQLRERDRLSAVLRELRAAEEHTAELARANAALQQTTDALAHLSTVDEIVPTVLRIVTAAFGTTASGYFETIKGRIYPRFYLTHGNVMRGMDFALTLGDDPEDQAVRHIFADGFTVSERYLPGGELPGMRTRATVMDHLHGTADPWLHRWAVRRGWNYELNVPLFVAEHEIGALVLYRTSTSFTQREVDLAVALSRQLSMAVQAAQLAEHSRALAVEGAVARERELAAEQRATELARANHALRRSVAKLAEVSEVEAAMVEAIAAAAEISEADGGALGVFLPEERGFRTVLQVMHGRGLAPEQAGYSQRLYSLDEPAIGLAWERFQAGDDVLWCERGSPYLAEDSRAYLDSQGMNSTVLVAVKRGSECIGYLGFFSRSQVTFPHSSRELLKAIASQMALMLETSRLAELQKRAAVAGAREQAALQRAAELARVNRSLEARSRLLRVVAEVSTEMARGASFEGSLRTTLARIGEAAELSRVLVIVEDREGDEPWQKVLAEWTREGVRTHAELGIAGFSDAEAKDLLALLRAGESFWKPIERVQEPLRSIFERLDIKATGCVPIVVDRAYAGCIAFDDCVSADGWEPDRIDALTAAANAIGAAFQERRSAERLAEERAAELARANSVLRRTNTGLVHAHSYRDLLSLILYEAGKITGALDGCINDFEPEAGLLRITSALYNGEQSATLPDHPFGHPDSPVPIDTFPAWQSMLARREPLFVEFDPALDERYPDVTRAWHQRRQHTLLAMAALVVEDKPLGLFCLGFCERKSLSPAELEMFNALAQQATLAMQMSRLADEARNAAVAREREQAAQERAEELARANAALQKTTDALAQLSTLDEIVPTVLRIVSSTFGAPSCGYYEFDPDNLIRLKYWWMQDRVFNPSEIRKCLGEHTVLQELIAGFRVPDGYLSAQLHARTKTDFIDHRAGTSRPDFDTWAVKNGWAMELNVPLVVNGRSIGSLVLLRDDRPYTAREVQLAEALCQQMTMAGQAARLAQHSRSLAVQRAVAEEREQAAQERAAELARANDALRRAADGLVDVERVEESLAVFLKQAMNVAGATAGLCSRRVGETEFEAVALLDGDDLYSGDELKQIPMIARFRTLSRQDPIGHFKRLAEGETMFWKLPELAQWYPEGADWQMERGNRSAWDVPFSLHGRVEGYLGLAFSDERQPDALVGETVAALASQTAVALEFQRISEEMKRAAVVEERNRFARDLHDTLAQGFSGILMQIGAAGQAVGFAPALQPYLQSIEQLARDSLLEARRSVRELRVGSRPGQTLPAELQALLERLPSTLPLKAHLCVTGEPFLLEAPVPQELLRIAQEALNNAVRHSAATSLQVQLQYGTGEVRLTVKDDGVGFSPEENPQAGRYGLLGMQERADRIGASLTLIAEPGRGTEIVVRWKKPVQGGGDL